MAIELKNLIDEACRRFERNFSAGDAAKLVNDYYASDVLIVGEGMVCGDKRFKEVNFPSAHHPAARRVYYPGAVPPPGGMRTEGPRTAVMLTSLVGSSALDDRLERPAPHRVVSEANYPRVKR
jgi:hypothetical protein